MNITEEALLEMSSRDNKDPNYWTRYFNNDHGKLRHNFPGSESIEKNYSQSMQDMFVLSILNGKKNGVYLEIGADLPRIVNNTYLLETEFDWTGVSFEWESDKVAQFYIDVREEAEKDTQYFFGPIVLVSPSGYNEQQIIDGQQRITCASIFIAVIADILFSTGEHGMEAYPDFASAK